MRQKLVVGAVIAIALAMATLEHVAGKHPTIDAPEITREMSPPPPAGLEIEDGGVSASPQLTH